ncbi:HD domain-containing protein [Anaeroglobus sp. AF13-6AC]|mgnify:FL=1|uniref:HD domain-containing protein n=1 Tax=Anaeroglobus sp. AF13-6AC TaxID=2997918 RepID=UPI0022E08583|nr:HD domain-containing protein [Anaeroglobus sp. AF13-6AC]
MDISKLTVAAITYDKGDAKRIQHFIKVHSFAELIGRMEGLDPRTLEILRTAAVLHDIGIHAAEEKYGNCSGKYQEIEGPAPAREILSRLTTDEELIDRVCFLIAHHHTYSGVNGSDWQILLEADFIVNAYEDALKADAIRHFRNNIFKTKSGLSLLNKIFAL